MHAPQILKIAQGLLAHTQTETGVSQKFKGEQWAFEIWLKIHLFRHDISELRRPIAVKL